MLPVDDHRRTLLSALLKGSALSAAALALGGCESLLEKIRNRPMRRDLATLAANDPIIDTYKAAVSAMKALPATDPRNWNNQAEIHFNHCPHGNWFFLPWHRAYLLYFEAICRELTGNAQFALPYWNWTCNRRIPAVFFGGASNPLFDATRTRSPSDELPDSVVGPAVITSILAEPNFLIFGSGPSATQRGSSTQGPLEATPHNFVHGWIGGNMGAFRSPRDPVFWTHHNMIDRIWWDWNVVMGHANTSDSAWSGFMFSGNFFTAAGAPVDITAGATVLGPLLLYRFDDSSITSCSPLRRFRLTDDVVTLRRFLETGAPVRLRPVRRLEAIGPMEVPVGRAGAQVLRSREAAPLALQELPKDLRLLLRATPARLPASGDYFVRVFINHPGPTAETPTSDPHYAGSFAFFNDETMPHAGGHAQHEAAAFLVDATEAIRRLGLLDRVRGGEIAVQVVPVPMPGREPAQRALALASLQLELSESTAAAPRPFATPN